MARKDLHQEPFDEATIAKLEIFQDYVEAWIPTFVMQQKVSAICIFDFFAGTGYDKNKIPGSSIRILEEIRKQIGNIFKSKIKIKVYLNEFEPNKKEQKKFMLLDGACSEYFEKHKDVARAIESHCLNEDVETLFPKLITEINTNPSLVYFDQNGIKFLSDKYLLELEKTRQTDFLYFVSSSYILRFGDEPEFKKHLDIDMSLAKKDPYKYIHRSVIDQLRKKLPSNTKLKLYPFSLKKGANIHGIIFGASHPRAVDKFLSIAWKRNSINGDANFDIDNDAIKVQTDIFCSPKTKIERFQENLQCKILSKEISNNFEVLQYVFAEGHIGKHAADCLKKMKNEGDITYSGTSPLVTYDNVYKNNKKIDYQILKNEA
jgi:three-Cys-motif partner protein